MRVWQLILLMLLIYVLSLSLSWTYVETIDEVVPFGIDYTEDGTPNES